MSFLQKHVLDNSVGEFFLLHRKRLLLVLTTLSLSLQAMLLSSVSTDKFYHHPSVSLAVTLLFEATKLIISLTLFFGSVREPAKELKLWHQNWEESKFFCIPALVYLINDNLMFIIYSIVGDPAVVELLLSLRILTTTIMFRGLLGKRGKMNSAQIAAMVLLTIGTASSQIATCESKLVLNIPIKGFVVIVLYCVLSAFAAVFIEYLLKRTGDTQSFYMQNVQLYAYGCLYNAAVIGVFYRRELSSVGLMELLGDNYRTVALILNNAVGGLLIAALVKYANTIEKVYAHSASMIVTLIASTIAFGQLPTIQLVFGALVTTISIFLYHHCDEEKEIHHEHEK